LHYLLTRQEFPPMTNLPPVHKLRPGISPRLAGAVNRAVCLEPERRPQTVRELQDILQGRRTMAPTAQLPRLAKSQATLALRRPAHPVTRSTSMRQRAATRRKGRAKGVSLMLLMVTMAFAGFAFTYLYGASPQLDALIKSKFPASPAR